MVGAVTTGRSYGDPHINTYDGYHYSFQTLGEYILTKSEDRMFEVQTRQSRVPNRESLTLNTAAAMNVCGTRVAFYVQDSPDGRSFLWQDGAPLLNGDENSAWTLGNGGSVERLNDRNYVVTWPSGDQVAIKEINVSGARFLNVMPMLSSEHTATMSGLLGNFDGNPDNDLTSRGGTSLATQSTYGVASTVARDFLPASMPIGQLTNAFNEQLSKQFGHSWLVGASESLFDYPVGMGPESFNDRTFPSQYVSLQNVSDEDIERAAETCTEQGVSAELMDGCIFDVAATGDPGFASAALNAVAEVVLEEVESRVRSEIEGEIRKQIPIKPEIIDPKLKWPF